MRVTDIGTTSAIIHSQFCFKILYWPNCPKGLYPAEIGIWQAQRIPSLNTPWSFTGHLYCEECYGKYLAPDCEKCRKKILGVSSLQCTSYYIQCGLSMIFGVGSYIFSLELQSAWWMVAIVFKRISISGICIPPKTSLTVRTVHTTVYVVSYVV